MIDELTIYNLSIKFPNTVDLVREVEKMVRADVGKDDLIIACIKHLKESDADEVKVSAHTEDGYKITVIVEVKEKIERGEE